MSAATIGTRAFRRAATAVLFACVSLCVLAPAAVANTGTVQGTVTDAATSAPIANVIVSIAVSGSDVGVTTTDASGNFTKQVTWAAGSPASLTVNFQPPPTGNRNYLSKSVVSTIASNGTATVVTTLQPGGQITGTVTDGLAGYGISNVRVFALDKHGAVQDSTCTANGSYGLQGLATGTYYVEFATPSASGCGAVGNYVTQYYDGQSSLGTASGVAVTAGSATSAINATLTASAARTLTVSRAGTGSGTVTSSPAAIDCGSKCAADLADGTPVTLTAVAASGSTFTGWSGGGCSGTDPCQLTMSSAQTVTATFVAAADQTGAPPPTPPATSTPPPPAPAKCTLVARSRKLQRKKAGKATVGKLPLTITCDEAADVTLSGKLTVVQKVAGIAKNKTQTFRLTQVRGKAKAGTPLTLTVTIPAAAVSALQKHAQESAVITLAATNANGTGHAKTIVKGLRV